MNFKQALADAAKQGPAEKAELITLNEYIDRVARTPVDRRDRARADLRDDHAPRAGSRRPARRRDVLRLLLRRPVRARRAAGARRALLRDRRAGPRDAPADPAAVGAARRREELRSPRCSSAASRRGRRTEDGAVYALQGCPMHEEPLHLIPAALRAAGARAHRRAGPGRPVPGVPLAARPRVRRRLPALPDRARPLLGGAADRHRHVRAGRPEVDEHGAAHRRAGLQGDRDARLGLASAGARLGRRVLEVQPRPLRGGRVLQEPGRVPQPVPDDGAGEAVQGRQVRLHRLRHGHRRAHERGGVPRVHGRPEERGAQGPPRHASPSRTTCASPTRRRSTASC